MNNTPICIPEIFDRIVGWAEEPEDILALALTSKWHASIISPHLDWCIISCDVRRSSVWNAFVEMPIHATRVRRLEIIVEAPHSASPSTVRLSPLLREEPAPPVLNPRSKRYWEMAVTAECDGIDCLSQTVQHMVNLRRFSWVALPESERGKQLQSLFYESLSQHCPSLRGIQVFAEELPAEKDGEGEEGEDSDRDDSRNSPGSSNIVSLLLYLISSGIDPHGMFIALAFLFCQLDERYRENPESRLQQGFDSIFRKFGDQSPSSTESLCQVLEGWDPSS